MDVCIDRQTDRQTDRLRNKAVYTTASVAYGWAGAVTQVLLPFGVFSKGRTNRRMDRQTDQPTE